MASGSDSSTAAGPNWDEGNTPEERMFHAIAMAINSEESPQQLMQRYYKLTDKQGSASSQCIPNINE